MADDGADGADGAMSPELARIRSALARGTSMDQALDDGASPATGRTGLARLSQRVRADLEGAGPLLQPLIDTEGVTDVLVGAGRTWIDRGHGLEDAGAHMPESQVRALAVRMAASAGRRLDDASPVVDATLPDGTRLNAVLPPLSSEGTLISLRTRRRRGYTLGELVAAGTVAPGMDGVLAALVERRASCLITGATGTGKTTLLAALLALVPGSERIICIEEASELRPDHPHVIHLQERGANVQGVGAVTMTSLVRTALRMRPDRIVLGECRGPEVRDVLTALNTGHEGGWATLHANSPADVPARLTALGALAGLDEAAVAAQAASALDAVVHLRRTAGQSSQPSRPGQPAQRGQPAQPGESSPPGRRGAHRWVASLGVLRRRVMAAGVALECQEALSVRADGAVEAGPGLEGLVACIGPEVVARALGSAVEPAPPGAPGSAAPGSTTTGLTAPGSVTPGSAAPAAPAAPASARAAARGPGGAWGAGGAR